MAYVRKPKPLTEMQQRFCDEYLSNGQDPERAALAAGYSEHSAHTKCWGLLRHRAIQEELRRRAYEVGANRDKVIEGIGDIAFRQDMADFWPLLIGQRTAPQLKLEGIDTRLIKRIKIRARRPRKDEIPNINERRETEIIEAELELHDRSRALGQLARILGLFDREESQAQEQTGPVQQVNVHVHTGTITALAAGQPHEIVPGLIEPEVYDEPVEPRALPEPPTGASQS